jgi:hypothetical protein
MRKRTLLALIACGLVIALGGPAAASTSAAAGRARPSEIAKMVCASEAQEDIATNLGNVQPTTVTTPTWKDSVYSCKYVYPSGAVTLSVKELRNAAATTRYFEKLGDTLGRRPGELALGDGAFTAKDGSVVVRKDFKVLDVDVSQLTGKLGTKPPLDASLVALNVAATVLGCWTGE